jgi:hypothetical protein
MKMKKKSSATKAKKTAPKKNPAASSAKPKKAAAARPAPASRAAGEDKVRPSGYTPPTVQGIGWAPFRYPPQ